MPGRAFAKSHRSACQRRAYPSAPLRWRHQVLAPERVDAQPSPGVPCHGVNRSGADSLRGAGAGREACGFVVESVDNSGQEADRAHLGNLWASRRRCHGRSRGPGVRTVSHMGKAAGRRRRSCGGGRRRPARVAQAAVGSSPHWGTHPQKLGVAQVFVTQDGAVWPSLT
jgi:hypothetical protein